ncbi:16S rRNA (cytosine(1402)-N(4))-methyltransferase RsmH [Geothermobacter hydrogeniphilus]|uniref:Ribosomal RNA small subunit methyltransferase H n=1 Tax=Geothermobacter hydrogeniphilus TaxID=1969733 RepID=A0A1X0YBI4_9BACT|nr:16S rRNA (cytosine(1402)-N(4))-methyltransferase RsmH [Geothermobacter hydrogeniphilus]ORJ62459.1 16S rRNA (cytosine(1402)-N(4))-methyltransferase [Geothermobacter hydrogeniphilus]
MTAAFEHLSVMPVEVLEFLAPRSGGVYLDGTVGGGGHARLVLQASAPDGRLIGLDRDRSALAAAAAELEPFADRVVLRHAPFADFEAVLEDLGIDRLDGMLLDLGVSSHQIDTPQRGFSFRHEGPLDMRMDRESGETAAEVLAHRDVDELTDIFRTYGEERFARRIARRIVARREEQPLVTTRQLADLVKEVVPASRDSRRIHPATRVFQALRIYVNGELDQVAEGVARGISRLRRGGRMVVISFHSLEDRIVKRAFQEAARGCICPPRLPICQCGQTPAVRILTRKVRRPGDEEIELNARARSAVLRAVEKL